MSAPIPRFDGLSAFLALPPEAQRNIGSLALELMAAWYGQEQALRAAPRGYTRENRIADAAASEAADLLQQAFVLSVPRDQLHDEARRVRVPACLGPVCVGCGCSQNDACPEGCAWASEDLCTRCAARRPA